MLFLIIVVLLQSGKAADLAGAFGGMGSQTAFGPRGSATLLSKATTDLGGAVHDHFAVAVDPGDAQAGLGNNGSGRPYRKQQRGARAVRAGPVPVPTEAGQRPADDPSRCRQRRRDRGQPGAAGAGSTAPAKK